MKVKQRLLLYGIIFILLHLGGLLIFIFYTNPPKYKNPIDLFREYCECTIQTEYVLKDKTRVDIITDTHVIEIDYASDFYEAIGQSLFYAEMTGLRPGILLHMQSGIKKKEDSKRYLDRLLIVAKKYKITVWILEDAAILLIYEGE